MIDLSIKLMSYKIFPIALNNYKKCMNKYRQSENKWLKPTGILMIPIFISGCSHIHLADQSPQINVTKLSQSTASVCGVAPFGFEPTDKDQADAMTSADLAKWHKIYFDAVNLSDICKETIKLDSSNNIHQNIDYLIDGKITDFYFKKNWVPVFFPLHIGISFFTLGLYTLAAGPTTTTKVSFKYVVNLKDAKSGAIINTIQKSYESTDPLNIYSSDTKNPYGNPSIAISPLVDHSLVMLAEAIRKNESKNKSQNLKINTDQ